MIKTEIVCVGKLKESYWTDACKEYAKRLSRFTKLEIKELPEGKNLDIEGEDILKACTGYKIALCVEGKKMTSCGFADKIKSLADEGKNMSFIIGSSTGLAPSVKKSADFCLSFSDMTFPHQLMRVVLLEQIYRSYMINSHSEYHK